MSTNLFEQCLRRGGYRAFGLQQSLLLYAVLLHLIEGTSDFPRRLRVLRNLIAASDDEMRIGRRGRCERPARQLAAAG